jgi:hypothetical protein
MKGIEPKCMFRGNPNVRDLPVECPHMDLIRCRGSIDFWFIKWVNDIRRRWVSYNNIGFVTHNQNK